MTKFDSVLGNKKLLLLSLLLILGVWLTYSNHFQNSFHFDDSHTIVNNAYIRSLHEIPHFFTDGNTFSSLPSNRSYRPLVSTTLAIDYALGGDKNMCWFHFSTFLLFLIQGVCMFFFIRVLFRTALPGSDPSLPALFTCAWYLLHPVNAETINYIIARSDTLSTLFVVIAFVLYTCSAVSRRYFLYLIPVALGALAKPTAVMFAPLLLLYILLFEQEKEEPFSTSALLQAFRKSIPAFLFCGASYLFIHFMEPATWVAGGEDSPWNYRITQPFVIFRYCYTFFLPVDLSADTDWEKIQTLSDPRLYVGFAFLLLLLLTTFLLARNKLYRPIAFGLGWFLLALVPTSITPLAEVMNDHRMFFPYVGLVISVSWSLYLLVRKLTLLSPPSQVGNLVAISSILLLGSYAFGTHQRNAVWHDEETLWKDVTGKSPGNGRGLMNYGLNLMARGDYAGAETYFKRGLERWPSYPYLFINMGVLKEATGKPAEAEASFRQAIACDSVIAKEPSGRNPECYFYYARFLKNQHRYPEAVILIQKLLLLSPGHLNGHALLTEINQLKTNPVNPNEAMDALIIKASNNPTADNYLELSMAYYQAGNYKLCISASQEALKLRKDYAEAWNNIGAAYGQLQNWDEEIRSCREALRINPGLELAKNNLAWALQHKK